MNTSWRSGALSAVSVLLLGLLLSLPSPARAQTAGFYANEAPCPTDVAGEITRQVSIIQPRLKSNYGQLRDMWLSDRDNGLFDTMSVCVSLAWPTGGFSLPTLDEIIEALLREAVRRICREARDAIRDVESIFGGQSYYMNSPIPGMGRIGGGWGSQATPGSGVNGNPGSFYVRVPSEEEWTEILIPEVAPEVNFTPDAGTTPEGQP